MNHFEKKNRNIPFEINVKYAFHPLNNFGRTDGQTSPQILFRVQKGIKKMP